jgi:hypothetical protein
MVIERKWEAANFAFLLFVISTEREKIMKNIRFVVRVNRGGTCSPQYVERIDRTPIRMTTHRRLALTMGRFTAEDAVKSIQNSRCNPELVPV